MGATLDRFSLLLTGWVPDLSRLPTRRMVALGAVLALLLHVILLPLIVLLLALGDLVFPHREERLPPAPEQNLEVEIVPPRPESAPTPAFEERRAIIDPRGLQASEEAPKEAKFESDQNMKAGSEAPANGLLPMPSQEGRTDLPTQDFADQDVHVSADDSAAAAVAAAAAEQAQAAPAQPPLYTPQPLDKAALAASDQARPDQKLPDPAKTARATPPPLERVAMLRPDQIAVMRPSEITAPGPITRLAPPTPPPRSSAATPPPKWMPMQSTPKPDVGLASVRYQESFRKTQVEGTISNHDKLGVDAVATPVGRWWMVTKNAIGKNWYLFLDQQRDVLSTGRVKVSFSIDESGKLHKLRVESGSGNPTLDEVCLRAIRETDIPPPPPDVMAPLPDRRMEQDVTFNYY